MKYSIGACSWSLKANTPAELVCLLREIGVSRVQLALAPVAQGIWPLDSVIKAFGQAGIEIRSGMIGMQDEDYSTPASIRRTGGVRSRKHWKANLNGARDCAAVARELGIQLVSFHAGWLPEDPTHKERAVILSRLSVIADLFAEQGISVALETGQESARTLLEALSDLDRGNLGVNFDPANMLMYSSGDPVESLRDLAEHVLQVHIKDARGSGDPEVFGAEVAVGTGEVDWPQFFEVLSCVRRPLDLMIEREAGSERPADMLRARDYLQALGVL